MTPRMLLLSHLLPLALVACTAADQPVELPEALPVIDSVAAGRLTPSSVSTGGDAVEVAWGYRFAVGDRLRMRRRTSATNRLSEPQFFSDDDEVVVEVERIGSDGAMTLTLSTLRNVMREKQKQEHPLVKSSYSRRTPKVRATVDRLGRITGGEILQDDEERMRMKSAAEQPGSQTWVRPDSSVAAHELRDFLPRLVGPSTLRIGETYRDTSLETRRSRVMSLDTSDLAQPVPGAMKRSPLDEADEIVTTMTTITTMTPIGWVEHEGERYLSVASTFHRVQELPGGLVAEYRSSTDYLVRTDGAIVRAHTRGTTTKNGEEDGAYEQLLELLRE